jgi:hypothetical protein
MQKQYPYATIHKCTNTLKIPYNILRCKFIDDGIDIDLIQKSLLNA